MPTFFTVLVRAPRRRSFSSRLVRKSSAPSNRAPFSPVFRSIFPLLLIVTFFAVSPLFGGCAAPKTRLPEVVGEEPSFEELKAVVNANSAKIESIYSSDATIGAENAPGWATCQIAFERPGNLRVIGTALAMGRVVDVGCNDERFWFWSNFQNKEELYFCRHDQYQNSAAARVLPVRAKVAAADLAVFFEKKRVNFFVRFERTPGFGANAGGFRRVFGREGGNSQNEGSDAVKWIK